MEQKITWMRLLFIGMLSSLLSCKSETDGVRYEEYRLINNTNYTLYIESFTRIDDDFINTPKIINPNDSLLQEIELFFGSKTGIVSLSDSVHVNYDSLRYINLTPLTDTKFNILDFGNYEQKIISAKRTRYIYRFTDDDFNNAISF